MCMDIPTCTTVRVSTFIHFNSATSHRHSSTKLYGLQANKLSTQNITPAGGPLPPSAVTYIVRLEKAMPPSNMVPYRRVFFQGSELSQVAKK